MQKAVGASKANLALEFSLFSNHDMIKEYAKYYDDKINDINIDYNDKDAETILKQMYGNEKEVYADMSLVYSKRIPLKNGRGNWSYHAGMQVNSLYFKKPKTFYRDFENNPHTFTGGFSENNFRAHRFFYGMDYDLTRRIKFISELFYDPGNKYVSFGESVGDYFGNGFIASNTKGKRKEFDFDFGVTFAPNETLRLGLHFQQPFITIYWKFLDY
jgi:hypothetical protein